ncbi:MAG TPA: hypothetical protein ENJ01_05405 [Gammaproteobacteria bacterium]|nr:hypothetical protein [Gammaproteobacteria bacterium]
MKLLRSFLVPRSALLLVLPVALLLWNWVMANETTPETVVAPLPARVSLDALSVERALDELGQRIAQYPTDHEARLLRGLLLFKSGRVQNALEEIDGLLQKAPEFHLAHLIKGDILHSTVDTVTDVGQVGILSTETAATYDRQLAQLRAEAEARLEAYMAQLDSRQIPDVLVQLDPSVEYAIVVDKSLNRLYLYHTTRSDAPPKLLRDLYVSTGKLGGNKKKRGDLKTPEGVYFVTSWIPDERLPAKYGIGAFPVNYPNELDRRLGKTGDGIWLHGTEPMYYSRPPRDSEGCVVLPNIDLGTLLDDITPGVTPVIISSEINWISVEQWRSMRQSMNDALEAWRRDWASLDTERYLSHYAEDFWSGRHDLASWAQRKRRIARGKTFQKINLSQVSFYRYPYTVDGREIVVARFRQDYVSNNYRGDVFKRLYLVRPQGQVNAPWKVLYEGS